MSERNDILSRALSRAGLADDPVALERFRAYHALLTERNRLMDLSNVPDVEMPDRHYADSIAPVLRYPELIGPDDSILDVGSGAGLPGIPLAILRPDQEVTLLEANGRRCDFLREVIGRLGLAKASVLESRAETAGQDVRHRERYMVTVSRAVAGLPELLEYMLPLTAVGGRALCWKGRRAEEELAAASAAVRALGGGELTALPYGGEGSDSVVVRAEKRAATPANYPRRVGIPHKRPIMEK